VTLPFADLDDAGLDAVAEEPGAAGDGWAGTNGYVTGRLAVFRLGFGFRMMMEEPLGRVAPPETSESVVPLPSALRGPDGCREATSRLADGVPPGAGLDNAAPGRDVKLEPGREPLGLPTAAGVEIAGDVSRA
jgi:hypothetical protein